MILREYSSEFENHGPRIPHLLVLHPTTVEKVLLCPSLKSHTTLTPSVYVDCYNPHTYIPAHISYYWYFSWAVKY